MSTVCTGCHNALGSQRVTVPGIGDLHAACFTCSACRTGLAGLGYVQRNAAAYCPECFAERFAPRCTTCREPILGRALKIGDQAWHEHHFRCKVCNVSLLGSNSFTQNDDKDVCCMTHAPAPVPDECMSCSQCHLPIPPGDYLQIGDRTLHVHCHVCSACRCELRDAPHVIIDGDVLCADDFARRFKETCDACDGPVHLDQTVVRALGRVWYDDHFRCKDCPAKLDASRFYVGRDMTVRCEQHHATEGTQGALPTCGACKQAVQCGLAFGGFSATGSDAVFHQECLVCEHSAPHALGRSDAVHVFDGRVFCRRHFLPGIASLLS
ncbi:LIM zinc-binding domain-containing protein [Plasmodiophora brassicae]